MASIRIIKRRIKSAKNIGQVTRALQMVSAVKMRRAQELAVAGKPYASELNAVLRNLTGKTEADAHPFLITPKTTGKIYLVVIGPDKGLAGSLVANLARKVFLTIDQLKNEYPNATVTAVSFGKKSRDILRKSGVQVVADFSVKTKGNKDEQIHAMSGFLAKAYLAHEADLIQIVYSNFINTVTQRPELLQFLPTSSANWKSGENKSDRVVTFEPSPTEVMTALLDHYLITILRQIILDSMAAEHSARMVAMKNASDNAADIVKGLTLTYNQTRQTAITNEIADIVSGAMEAI